MVEKNGSGIRTDVESLDCFVGIDVSKRQASKSAILSFMKILTEKNFVIRKINILALTSMRCLLTLKLHG